MAAGNVVTVVGNVTRDPELRYTPSGASVCNFSLAWNNRYERNGQQVEQVSYFDVVVWREQAENVAASLTKGMRVVVTGRLDQRSWDDAQTGAKRSKVELVADEVGPSLRWASAEIRRNERNDGGGGYGGGNYGGGAPQQGGGAPQGGAPMGGGAPQQGQPEYNYDEEPF